MKCLKAPKYLLLMAGILFLHPLLAQEDTPTSEKTEAKPTRDISGLYQGKWESYSGQKGDVEIKIYKSYEGTYGGYLLFTDRQDKTHTGSLSFTLVDDYFSGYYTPSVMSYEPADSSALNCQLILNGMVQANKQQKLILNGEGVSNGCQTNGIVFLEMKQSELLVEKKTVAKE